VTIGLQPIDRFVALDIVWNGPGLALQNLGELPRPGLHPTQGTISLQEIAERHGGEIWSQTKPFSNQAYVRWLLPMTQPKHLGNVPSVKQKSDSRPEFYDFDLFHQPGQTSALDQRSLATLTYTVFDTETTGLNPSAGDEIISIGAVRIVNARLLHQEVFDQLVNPKRPVSRMATQIHGLSNDALQGQPTIEQVLPQFHRFCEDTVLVAHNAAFDMRLLQLKEAQTGVTFDNPVLDTLLLSAVVHPNHSDHSLEAIAARLGIDAIGRHTALGDAMLTAEIFLKLIRLLERKGIRTLAEARTAAEQTYYARLRY
jgi:DNA polymerase-3 subunit epsilon